jgi:hypothetical protein
VSVVNKGLISAEEVRRHNSENLTNPDVQTDISLATGLGSDQPT